MHELNEGLSGFAWALVVLIPAVPAIATLGGWWMSRGAPEPVDQIVDVAGAIGEKSPGRRLPVLAARGKNRTLQICRVIRSAESTAYGAQICARAAVRQSCHGLPDTRHELPRLELALRKQRNAPEYREALEEVHSELVRTTEDKSRSRDFGGAGLGLSIAKWIAEAHAGAIEARSDPSGGSTFTITLQAGEATL